VVPCAKAESPHNSKPFEPQSMLLPAFIALFGIGAALFMVGFVN
jgi:hypothetical protein